MTHSLRCTVCGSAFEDVQPKRKTCSHECRAKRVRIVPSKKQDRSNMRLLPEMIAGPNPFGLPERWRELSEFPGYYISDCGRVCDVDRITADDKMHRGRVLKPASQPTGHKYVVFYGGHHRQVHRLVLTEFVGPCPPDHEALHADDVSHNNVLWNLRWGTRSDNLHDGIRNGKIAIGIDKPQAKLNDDAVRFIRANLHIGDHNLSKNFGVSAAAVKQVRDGVTWKHVT